MRTRFLIPDNHIAAQPCSSVTVAELDDDRDLVIHAMPLRPSFFSLLADEEPRQ
ncbi:MAG: hypothetical protein R2726_17730 [Acidimicrobiales bacterium]